jgi:hypothetical protein
LKPNRALKITKQLFPLKTLQVKEMDMELKNMPVRTNMKETLWMAK